MKLIKKDIILTKIIILFLVIVIPMILFSSVNMIRSNNLLINETIKSISEKNQTFADNLDNEFNTISISASNITVHSKVRKLSYLSDLMSNYEKSQAVQQIREYISSIKESSKLIHNIRVYIPSVGKAYNSSHYRGGREKLIFEGGSYQDITLDTYENIISLRDNNPFPIIYTDNELIIIRFPSIKNPANIAEVNLSADYLTKRLESQNMYHNALYLFYLEDNSYELGNIQDNTFCNLVKNAVYKNGVADIKYKNSSYDAFRSYLEFSHSYYIQIIPTNTLAEPYRLPILYSIFFIIFMVLCVLLFSYGVIKLIHHPLTKLVHAFQAVEKGNLQIRISETEQSEFSYLYQGFNKMTQNLEAVIDEVYNQDLLLQKAEFKQLQAQINPHFLYNSFFMLQRMIQYGIQEEAIQVSKELGVYFKYITRNNSDFELFKDEYRHAKIYSRIQSMRFEDRISTEFGDLPKEYENLQVPRLILQPIIENAYNYGLENKIIDGLLRVHFTPKERGIEIVIEDNGDHLSDEMIHQINCNIEQSKNLICTNEVTGILNIFRRIRTFYKNSSNLSISRSDLGGMKVIIFLTERSEET